MHPARSPSQPQTKLSCHRRNLVSDCFSLSRNLTVKDMMEFSRGGRKFYILFEDLCSMLEGVCFRYFGVTSEPSLVSARTLLTRIFQKLTSYITNHNEFSNLLIHILLILRDEQNGTGFLSLSTVKIRSASWDLESNRCDILWLN